jgi:hypothetical protein
MVSPKEYPKSPTANLKPLKSKTDKFKLPQ